jgi:putative radical SAM enzyme (TIGR03279 family)
MKRKTNNVVSSVYPDSIAEEMEIEVGDLLLTINGKEVIDIIDYLFLVVDDFLEVEIQKPDGEVWALEIEKDYDEQLGIEFSNPILDCAQSCTNKCIFCFVDQMPDGMRESLYFKDDDSRLSFLQGNFVTLTNLKDEDIDRMIDYNISPINVSVHTTDPELRKEMLHNRFAGNVLERLKKLVDNRITVNGQIVMCPGYNDGDELIRTVKTLYDLGENFNTLAIVPIGMTKFRQGLAKIDPVTKEVALRTIKDIEALQERFLEESGRRFAYLSDEFYIRAELDMPSVENYDGFIQLENGVGLVRKLDAEIQMLLKNLEPEAIKPKEITIATGKLAEPFIKKMANRIMQAVKGVEIEVIGVENNFFGPLITVAGLVTGQDLMAQLKGRIKGDTLLIPKVMLKSDEPIFLDDYTVEQIEEALSVRVLDVLNEGHDFVEKIVY